MKRWISVLGAGLLLGACGSNVGGSPGVGVSPGVSATAPIVPPTVPVSPSVPAPTTSGSQSVSVPLAVRLDLDPQQLAVGEAAPLVLQVSVARAAQHVRGRILGSGVVSVAEPAEQEWTNVAAGQTEQIQTTILLTGQGPGQISGVAEVLDPPGASAAYGLDTTVFVLATDLGVLTGTHGPQQLRREYLDLAHAAGKITREEYERAREENQYGGAQTGITITVPTPVP